MSQGVDATAQSSQGPTRSAGEERNLQLIRQFHDAGTSIQRLRESGLLAEDVEWWVAGPRAALPFAGTWRGPDGVAEFHRILGETMRYDRTELKEYIVDGDNVAAIFVGEGIARATGKPFRSEIMRLYTFKDGKIVRVRNFYDTAAYVAAVAGN